MPLFRVQVRGRAKVTLFIEKKAFPDARESKSDRATNGDPKVAGNAEKNAVSELIAGIRAIRCI